MDYRGRRYRFLLGPRLGAGGMAEVFLATRVDDPRIAVAVKIPRGDLPPEIDGEMFLREAAAAAAVDHPNVVKVIDWGESPPFIAFEFVEGRTLDRVISERQSTRDNFRLPELLGIFRSLAAGLAAINETLVHRDFKPGNIFFTDTGPKISDLGLAKYIDEATRAKTFKGWGSLPYMAPESFRGDSLDWRADQYALGIVFYELATLERPFHGDGAELERQHLYERPRRLTQFRPDLPESLATVVSRMMEKRAGDRFPRWSEVKEALSGTETSSDDMSQDPVVMAAVARLEEVRANELASRMAAEDERKKRIERQELLTYWADVLFGQLQSRIDGVNRAIGETAIQYARTDPSPLARGNPVLTASFLSARLSVSLESVPPDADADFILWGAISLSTNRRGWFGNLVLEPQPVPYGQWSQVDLEMNPITRNQTRPEQEDQNGGKYEVIGGGRLVLARNWQGLHFQRQMRNVLSVVQYREQDLNMEELMTEWLEIMTQDGAVPPESSR